MKNRYMATCIPGAELILKDEICELITTKNNLSISRGKVFFDSVSKLDIIMNLRCADNIYLVLNKFSIGPYKEDLKIYYNEIKKTDLKPILHDTYIHRHNKTYTINHKDKYKIIVSASRSGKHTYSRHDLSAAATDALLSLGYFISGDEKDHDIALRIDVKDNICCFFMQLTLAEFRFRGNCFHSSMGGLRPSAAHCLVRVGGPKNNDVFYDPFCGAGTIPYERALYKYKKIFASDINEKAVHIAGENINNDIILFKADAVHTNMKDESIDVIVTNMPWGKQITADDLNGLYHDFIKELKRILKSSGRAVILTDRHELLSDACNRCELTLTKYADLSLHGLHPSIYIIKKANDI